ncbi:MAG: glycosyltransferase family 9 protein, partial [Gammaproteobacteria bacterium]
MKPLRKALIIKWGALGDVVVATPHIETILSAYPDTEFWLLTAPAYAPLFVRHPRLQLVVRKRRGFWEMARTLAWVVSQRFDAVFDLQGNDRSAALTWCSRAALRTGLGPAYAYTEIPPSREQRDRHIFERLNGLLTHLGLPEAPPRPRLQVGEPERRKVAD